MADVYHSRTGSEGEIVERKDPILRSGRHGDGPLSPDQLSAFERDGFVIIPALLSPAEIARLVDEAASMAETTAAERPEEVIREPDSEVVRSLFRVHQDRGAFASLAADERLRRAAGQILGGDVYVHQSRINFMPSFDGRTFFWHSDFETWHVEDGMPRMRALSTSVFLTHNTTVNGSLMLIPGSHRLYVRCVGRTPPDHYQQSLRSQRYGVPAREALARLVSYGGIVQAVGPAGSVILFDCNTMHGSTGNISPYPRHNVFVVYNSVENRLVAPFGGLEPRPGFLAERDPRATLA